MLIETVLLVLASYLLGATPLAFLIAKKARNIDLREYGSGNVGMSNLWKQTSGWLTVPVIIFDLGKGAMMVWTAQFLGLEIALQVIVALSAVLGHAWPVFLRFSGGRGILTTLGITLALPALNGLIPWGGMTALFITVIGWLVFHNSPVGVAVALLTLPIVSWTVGEPIPLTVCFVILFIVLMIRRLTAPLTSVSNSVSRRRLLINRLVFDRDIMNRKEWVNRVPFGTSSGK